MLFFWKTIFMLTYHFLRFTFSQSEIKSSRDTYLSGCVDLLHLHPLLQQEDPKTESIKDHYIMLFRLLRH